MMSNIVELIKHRITPMDSEHRDINITRTFHRDDYKSLDVIIELLQQGEAYRQMWEDIKEYVFNDEERSLLIHTGDTKKIMKNMEKKYFPKKCKKEVKTNGSG